MAQFDIPKPKKPKTEKIESPTPEKSIKSPAQHKKPTKPTKSNFVGKKRKTFRRRVLLARIIVLLIGALGIGLFSFFFYLTSLLNNELVYFNADAQEQKQTVRLGKINKDTFSKSIVAILFDKTPNLIGEDEGRVNFLLLGAPGQGNPAPNLTDAIMLASLDTKQEKISLVSIPRDLFVRAPGENVARKINSLYQLGLIRDKQDPLKILINTVEELSGQTIHYVLLVDLSVVEDSINSLGGITVNVPQDIYDPTYPGPNYSYELFELKKGVQTLDGKTAVKYVRTRHAIRSDFGRSDRQRQVLQALSAKLRNIELTDLPVYFKIASQFKQRIATNMSIPELKRLYTLTKDISSKRIYTWGLDTTPGSGMLRSTSIKVGSGNAYALVPINGINEYKEIHAFFKNIFQKI